ETVSGGAHPEERPPKLHDEGLRRQDTGLGGFGSFRGPGPRLHAERNQVLRDSGEVHSPDEDRAYREPALIAQGNLHWTAFTGQMGACRQPPRPNLLIGKGCNESS